MDMNTLNTRITLDQIKVSNLIDSARSLYKEKLAELNEPCRSHGGLAAAGYAQGLTDMLHLLTGINDEEILYAIKH